jgi:hypothetical protein
MRKYDQIAAEQSRAEEPDWSCPVKEHCIWDAKVTSGTVADARESCFLLMYLLCRSTYALTWPAS